MDYDKGLIAIVFCVLFLIEMNLPIIVCRDGGNPLMSWEKNQCFSIRYVLASCYHVSTMSLMLLSLVNRMSQYMKEKNRHNSSFFSHVCDVCTLMST